MGAATNYLENKILDHILGRVTYTAPTNLYIGLATNVDDEGNITGEPSSEAGYARVEVPNNTTNFPNAVNGTKSNGTPIEFPEATGDWGTINYTFIADGDIGYENTNVLLYSQLTVPKVISAGDTVSFLAGKLTYSVD